MKGYLISLPIRELQIKTMRYHDTTNRMAKMQIIGIPSGDKEAEKLR